jgi:hypothetical protein
MVAWLSNNLWIFLAVPYIWIEVMALAILGMGVRSTDNALAECPELTSISPSL